MSTLEITSVESATVPLESIRRDDALICRAKGVNAATVKEYAEAMKGGTVFPPVVVFRDSKGTCVLADGFHRCGAAELAGLVEIAADVREGGRREALLHAASANVAHGLRRTGADKRRSVELVLGAYPKRSDRWVAEQCGVGHQLVGTVRRKVDESSTPEGERAEATDKAPTFDAARELAKVERALGTLVERWPARDATGRAKLAAMLTAWGARLATVERPKRPAKTNGSASPTVEAATG
jgi:hypothetical protein